MNEKLQYAEMLEIPVSTCNITYKSSKKKGKSQTRRVNADTVKQELIDKVNENSTRDVNTATEDYYRVERPVTATDTTESKKRFKLNVIGVQLIIIGLLVATIFLTSALVPNSGINVFMKNVFGTENVVEQVVNQRLYNEFDAVLPVNGIDNVQVEKGVTTLTSTGSLYSPCDGKVSVLSLDEETNKYTIEIEHSENFKTVFTGIDYAYSAVGDMVYSNIPVGYIMENATMCFYDGEGQIITDYTLSENAIIWAV